MRPILASLALPALLAGCMALDPHNMIGRQLGEATGVPTEVVPSSGPRALDGAARAAAFDYVWRTIDRNYHDRSFNGVDWAGVGERYRPRAMDAPDDAGFWDMLDLMAGELKDAHTRVESPRQVELRKRSEIVTLGFSIAPVEGKLAVAAISASSDAWWAGVRPGMTLASIAGEPVDEAYRRILGATRRDSTDRSQRLRAIRRLFAGDPGAAVDLVFDRGDGTRIEVRATRRRLATHATETHRVLPSGFGYLRFTQWTLGVMPRVLGGLDELSRTPGLVIDLRGNPGGAVHAVNALLERFFPVRTELGHTTTRTGRPVSLLFGAVEIIKLRTVVDGSADAYRGPVVILTDAHTASGSELFAGTMQAVGRAKIVGEPTCGCLLGFLGYARIPGGGELAYSEVGFVMADGTRIEGEGIAPGHPVPVTLQDLRLGRDRALEEAQDLLRTLPAWKP